MDIDKGSPPQTMIKMIDIPYPSPVGGQSFSFTPTLERQQTIQVSSSTKVTKRKKTLYLIPLGKSKLGMKFSRRALMLSFGSRLLPSSIGY